MPPATIPIPASSAAHTLLRTNQSLKITSHAGTQVFDLFAFHLPRDDSTTTTTTHPSHPSHLSMPHTRASLLTTSVTAGDTLVSNTRTPMLTFVEDSTASGTHDTLFPACDAARYAQLGARADHPSCVGNLVKEAAVAGVLVVLNAAAGSVQTPDALNLFMNVTVGEGGRMAIGPTDGTKGGFVVFQAKVDCVVIVCACSMDLVPGNGEELTGGEMQVLE